MNFIWGLLVGIVVSTIVCLIWLKGKKSTETVAEQKRDIIAESRERHAEIISKLESYLAGKTEVANGEIQSFLGVSDASAERYLQELEEAGKLRQVGKTGNQVKYQVL